MLPLNLTRVVGHDGSMHGPLLATSYKVKSFFKNVEITVSVVEHATPQ